MNKKNIFKLKLMYWYNIFITGGFACVIFAATYIPSLRDYFCWQGADPLVASLIVPLFFIISLFCIKFLSKPEEGIVLLKIQVFYKPLAILFLVYNILTNAINVYWGILVIAGLLIYVIGNIWAIPWKNKDVIKES